MRCIYRIGGIRLTNSQMKELIRLAQCACGQVSYQGVGTPILTAVCYCEDCQSGGQMIESLPNAAPLRDADGGTPYLTYRDDRWQCVEGASLLREYRIKPDSQTRRFVAQCCNSAMFLKYEPGFWVSTYQYRYLDSVPPLQFRNQIRHRKSELPLPSDAPAFQRFPLRLFTKLTAARFAMWFRR